MYNLSQLLEIQSGKLSGPFSPVHAAKEMAKYLGIKISGLVRVNFDDPEMNQRIEEGYPTGFDTLVMVGKFTSGDMYFMFVDMGERYVPAFMFQYGDDEEPFESAAYKEEKFALSITKEQAKMIFDSIREQGIAYAKGLEVENV